MQAPFSPVEHDAAQPITKHYMTPIYPRKDRIRSRRFMKLKHVQILATTGSVIVGISAVLYANYESPHTHDDTWETTCAKNTVCTTPQGYAHAGTIYLDYDLEQGDSVKVLKIVADDHDLANCAFSDTTHVSGTGTVSCRLDRDSMVVAYVQTQNSGPIGIGWHQ
jgi:hypothetical protein